MTIKRITAALPAVLIIALSVDCIAQAPPLPTLTPAQSVLQALAAHGAASATVVDSIGDGTLTVFADTGAIASVPFQLLRSGMLNVQRILPDGTEEVREGTDGRQTWRSFQSGKVIFPATGLSLHLIETESSRSIQRLFNFQTQGLTLTAKAGRGNTQAIEAQDSQGRKTTYFIDNAISTISMLEFELGVANDAVSGAPVTLMHTYVFSDYRSIQGVLTPFTIERYHLGRRVEQMDFTAVQYNASVPAGAFRP